MMRVNIETQWICEPPESIRGVPIYIIKLINSLVLRNNNKYSISFFDPHSEQNNLKYMYDYIGGEALGSLEVFECNSTSYKMITDANIAGRPSLYDAVPYSAYTGARADVFHFPCPLTIPFNVDGRVVVTVHDMLPLLSRFSRYWSKAVCASTDASVRYMEKQKDIILIAVSESTKNDIVEYSSISPERVHVVPQGYDKSTHFPERNLGMLSEMGIHAPYLLYLGALDFRKGVVEAIDAFEIAKPKFRDLKLILAGKLTSDIKPIHEMLASCRYRSDVILPGYVNDEQKRALLSSASIFLFPSEYEGFGFPVLEAMACGSPVITTNVSSLPEVGGDAVVYVAPRDSEQLAFEIERLLNSDSLRKEYIQKGFDQSAKFSWERTAAMTEDVYDIAYEQIEMPSKYEQFELPSKKESAKKMRTVVYGIGRNFMKYKDEIYRKHQVVLLVDNSDSVQGKVIDGLVVAHPSEMLSYEFDEILFTASRPLVDEMVASLIRDGIPTSKLKHFFFPIEISIAHSDARD